MYQWYIFFLNGNSEVFKLYFALSLWEEDNVQTAYQWLHYAKTGYGVPADIWHITLKTKQM